MKPLTVSLVGAAMIAALPALALRESGAGIRLPAYTGPVTFFQEGVQGLDLGNLPSGIKSLSAGACMECHEQEHAEWKASAHARSVTEPVFAAAFQSEPRFLCRSCHSPLLEQHPLLQQPVQASVSGPGAPVAQAETGGGTVPSPQPAEPAVQQPVQQQLRGLAAPAVGGKPNPHYQEALVSEGVTCVTCHVREGTVLTSLKTIGKAAPHALSYSPALAKAEFCAGCHQFDVRSPQSHPFERAPAGLDELKRGGVNRLAQTAEPAPQPEGTGAPDSDVNSEEPPVPSQPFLHSQYQQEPRVQHSLDEFRLSASAAQGGACQSCHMPVVQGRAAHTWPGRNSDAMLKQAVQLTARLDRSEYRAGETLQAVIKLKNDAGHSFPTGDSVHAGLLDVWLQDGKKTLGRRVFVMSGPTGMAVPGNQLQLRREAGPQSGGPRDNVDGGIANGIVTLEVRTGSGPRLEGPGRSDTRLLPGEEAMLVYSQPLSAEIARASAPVLRVRLFHAAIHPGFKGTPLDPKLAPLRLIREAELPLRIAAPAPVGPRTAAAAPPSAAPRRAQP